MITFKSRDDQVKFINDLMNRLIHHRFADQVCDVDIGGDDPYVYRHFSGVGIFVMMTTVSVGVELKLTIGNAMVLHRAFRLVEKDPIEIVTLAFISFCEKADAIEKILTAPQGE